ncbi:hypothetical protein TNCT6_53350 [Streptomyces sp. 6-11-2]|nr:hypothetical protein TNCT6_53350 [Streptomyces sp. 6-11-2]
MSSKRAVTQSSSGRLNRSRAAPTYDSSTRASTDSTPTGTATQHPPARRPGATRFAVKEAETTGFAVKRLDWMTTDNCDVPDLSQRRCTGLTED